MHIVIIIIVKGFFALLTIDVIVDTKKSRSLKKKA